MSPDEPATSRALHVVSRYRRGESATRVADLVGALPELAHTVLVGVDSDVDLAREQLPTAEIEVLPSLQRSLSPWAGAVTLVRLARLLRSGEFALAFSHQTAAGTLLRTASFVAPDVPVVHSLTEASFGSGHGRVADAVSRKVEQLLSRRTARYVAVTERLVDRYQELGIDPELFRVIRSGNPLPTNRMWRTEARLRLGLPVDVPVVAYQGPLEARDGVTQLPDLLHRITRQPAIGSPHMVVAGDGPQADELQAEAVRLGVAERVHLLGDVDDTTPLLFAADVMVFPSSRDGMPEALLQSAATGLPFVSYDLDGARELLDLDATGEVVPHGAISRLANVVLEMLNRDCHGGSGIDVESWRPEAIQSGYRELVAGVAAGLVHEHLPDRRPMADQETDLEPVRPRQTERGLVRERQRETSPLFKPAA